MTRDGKTPYRGCLITVLILSFLVALGVGVPAGYLAHEKPEMFTYYLDLLQDKAESVFFPPVEALKHVPEPRVYLQVHELEYCGKDYTPSLPALRPIFDNGDDISAGESEKNIMEHMVRLSRSGADYCSGLQLTTDGFILTAHHCIDKYEIAWSSHLHGRSLGSKHEELMSELREIEIIDRHGDTSHIDEGFLATFQVYDLALIKANLEEGEHLPVRFNVSLADPEISDPVELLAFKDGILMMYDGNVIAPTIDSNYIDNTGVPDVDPRIMEDILFTNVYIEGGFSGGVIISDSGELMGTNAWGTGFGMSEDDLVSGHAKAKHIDTLVRRAYDELHRTDGSECSGEPWEEL